jgi:hypothetical protein
MKSLLCFENSPTNLILGSTEMPSPVCGSESLATASADYGHFSVIYGIFSDHWSEGESVCQGSWRDVRSPGLRVAETSSTQLGFVTPPSSLRHSASWHISFIFHSPFVILLLLLSLFFSLKPQLTCHQEKTGQIQQSKQGRG